MSYQTQKQPEYKGFPDEEAEEEPRETAAPAPAQKKTMSPGLRVLLVILVSAVFFSAGVYLRTRMNDPFAASADPGFLSLPEFVLRDYETGEPVQNESLNNFSDKYTFTYSLYNYETSRGTRIGDSWNDFVDTYGDVNVYEVSVDGSVYPLDSVMTLQKFHEDYVLSGKISPSASAIEITFMTGTDGKTLWYSDMDLLRAKDSYRNKPDILRPILGRDQKPAVFRLSFTFVPSAEGTGTLDFIYSGNRVPD